MPTQCAAKATRMSTYLRKAMFGEIFPKKDEYTPLLSENHEDLMETLANVDDFYRTGENVFPVRPAGLPPPQIRPAIRIPELVNGLRVQGREQKKTATVGHDALRCMQEAIKTTEKHGLLAWRNWAFLVNYCNEISIPFSALLDTVQGDGTTALEHVMRSREWKSITVISKALVHGWYAEGRVVRYRQGIFCVKDGMANGPGIFWGNQRTIFGAEFSNNCPVSFRDRSMAYMVPVSPKDDVGQTPRS